MTALTSPTFTLRSQRDGLRQKQFSLSRPRAASNTLAAIDAVHGAALDCVFKRFPAIGDTAFNTPSVKQRW